MIKVNGQPISFIQVHTFSCPIREDIPAYKKEAGLYLFPFPGELVFGISLPSTTDPELIAKFEAFLSSDSAYATSQELSDATNGEAGGESSAPLVPPPPSSEEGEVVEGRAPSDSVSSSKSGSRVADAGMSLAGSLERGGKRVAEGIVAGASKFGSVVASGGTKLKSKIKKKEEPTKVNPKIHENIQKARVVTGMGIKVSAGLVKFVITTATTLASTAADTFHETSVGKKMAGKSGPKTAAAKQVGASSLRAFGEVYLALDTAARVIIRDVSSTTTGVVQHRYGDDAAKVSSESLGVFEDVANTALNFKKIGPSTVAKRAAMETTAQVLDPTKGPVMADEEKMDPETGMAALALAKYGEMDEEPKPDLPPPPSA